MPWRIVALIALLCVHLVTPNVVIERSHVRTEPRTKCCISCSISARDVHYSGLEVRSCAFGLLEVGVIAANDCPLVCYPSVSFFTASRLSIPHPVRSCVRLFLTSSSSLALHLAGFPSTDATYTPRSPPSDLTASLHRGAWVAAHAFPVQDSLFHFVLGANTERNHFFAEICHSHLGILHQPFTPAITHPSLPPSLSFSSVFSRSIFPYPLS